MSNSNPIDWTPEMEKELDNAIVKLNTMRNLEIIEHLERGIQEERDFSFNLAVKWASGSVDLMKAEIPHETELIDQIRRIFHLKPYNGKEYACEVVNRIYRGVIDELREAFIKEYEGCKPC